MTRAGKFRGWTLVSVIACSFLLSRRGEGSEWPQYRGATHNGISPDRILKPWTGTATNPLWRVMVPNALCSAVAGGGRGFTQTRRNLLGVPKEYCVALSATTGAELWAALIDSASYPEGGVGTDDGPRTTPALSDDSVFVLSSYLKLYRLNVTNGAVIWQRDLRSEYGGSVIGWQNAASPVIENDLIYVNANCGANTLMALRISDGGPAWRARNEAMTHSTPILTTLFGVRQVLFATQSGVVSLAPLSGNLLWKFNYPFPYSTSIGASPVVSSNMVFVTGAHAYGMASTAFQVNFAGNVWTTQPLWSGNSTTAHWMTPVAHEGFLYGQFGIQQFDSANAQLKCIDMRTGAVKWSTNGFGRGGTILVNGHLATLTERGQLVLSKPNTNAYMEVARCLAIPNYNGTTNKCWNEPVVADGRVYARSTAMLAAFDFSVPDLQFELPQIVANEFRLTVRTVDGTPLNSNRVAGVEIRTTTNLALALEQWMRLTNGAALTNGALRIGNAGSVGEAQRFFVVRETE